VALMAFPILTAIVFLPALGALLLLLIRDERNEALIKKTALVVSLLVFAETLLLAWEFNPAIADFQFVERHQWIPAFGISYAVGVDGISLWLLVLTGFLTPIALLSAWEAVHM
jgi:NADH-quinone oxidoreductase subunit M